MKNIEKLKQRGKSKNQYIAKFILKFKTASKSLNLFKDLSIHVVSEILISFCLCNIKYFLT